MTPPEWGLARSAGLSRFPRSRASGLQLGLHEEGRAWNGFDWGAMQRLHAEGYIAKPVGKAKAVEFTETGLRESERLLRARFGR